MLKRVNPKIGVLALMQGIYDSSQPELAVMQTEYVNNVIAQISDNVDFVFPGLSKYREDTERIVAKFNADELDGIMIINAIYTPALRLVPAFKKNRLPVMLACIQPLPEVTPDWNWSLLTTNQAIHGIQDTSNVLMRLGYKPAIITEDWKSDNFKRFTEEWAYAAATAKALSKVRLVLMQKHENMGDILGDEVAYYEKLGIEVVQEGIGQLYRLINTASADEVKKKIEEDRDRFEIDENLKKENHEYAVKFQIALEKFCENKHYDGFSINHSAFSDDGRFLQLPLLAACNMMAEGYVYGAEGDVNAMALEAMGMLMIGDSHFTEMYSLDFKRDACLLSHMGEGNWKVARKDRPVKLIDRPLDLGGLDNPPTPVFAGEVGVATVASLVNVRGDQFRMLIMRGENLDEPLIPGIPMNHTFFKPDIGIKKAMDKWLQFGGTHHEIMWIGDHVEALKKLCNIMEIEIVEI